MTSLWSLIHRSANCTFRVPTVTTNCHKTKLTSDSEFTIILDGHELSLQACACVRGASILHSFKKGALSEILILLALYPSRRRLPQVGQGGFAIALNHGVHALLCYRYLPRTPQTPAPRAPTPIHATGAGLTCATDD